MRGKNRFFKSLCCMVLAALLLLSGFPYPGQVYSAAGNPDFSITRSIDRTSFKEGETGTLTYTVTPSGTATTSAISADIVLVFDVSPSMVGSKLAKAKEAAQSFLNRLNGGNAKVAIVTFSYKVGYTAALSSDYTKVSRSISDIKNSESFEGTNYHDAFSEAYKLLKTGTSKNKYVVLLSDGMPNYFTSGISVKKYEKNYYSKYDNSTKKYYFTNWPRNTPEGYDYGTDVVKQMSKEKIMLFNIGLGKRNEVDLNYLGELSDITGGQTFPSARESELETIYKRISQEILISKISNLQILDVLPPGVSLAESKDALIREDGKLQINLQDIVYDSTTTTPASFRATVKVVFNKSGTYTFNQGVINYTVWNGVNNSKSINSVTVNVAATQQPPGIQVSRQSDKTTAIEGEVVKLKYTVKPMGVFIKDVTKRAPVDIVLVMDKSTSMLESTGGRSNTKLKDAKAAAASFVTFIKSKELGDRISLVTFNRYSKADVGLTKDYDSVISKINGISPDDELDTDQGTNYEIGLNTAKDMLVDSTNKAKYIIFLSDGEPNYYVDSYTNHTNIISSDYFNNGSLFVKSEYNIFYDYKRKYGIDTAYDKMWKELKLEDRNLKHGEYTYYMGDNIYGEVQDTAKSIAKLGITIHTIGLGSPQELDMAIMDDIAKAGGGNSYKSENSGSLSDIFKDISNSITQQKLSNIAVTVNLPSDAEALEDTNLTLEGGKATFRIPEIIFEKDKGTPSPIEYTLKLKFNKSGLYNLKNDSSVAYVSYDGSGMSKGFNDLTVNILKPDYSIGELKADPVLSGSKTTSIKVTWDKDEIDYLENVREFILQRSINGSNFAEVGRPGSQSELFTDNSVGASGTYVYKIITVVKGQNGQPDTLVEGATSNAVEVKNASSNISTIQSATIVNNLLNSNTVVDGFRVTSRFTITIVDESAGVSAGGIQNPAFTFTLNRDRDTRINCNFTSNNKEITLMDSNRAVKASQVITAFGSNAKQFTFQYNGTLAPGTYYMEFSFVPEKSIGTIIPEDGIPIGNSMQMKWKDYGIDQQKDSDNVFAGDHAKSLLFDLNIVKKPMLN
jgi:Mg-chelatase subunit ChlD